MPTDLSLIQPGNSSPFLTDCGFFFSFLFKLFACCMEYESEGGNWNSQNTYGVTGHVDEIGSLFGYR